MLSPMGRLELPSTRVVPRVRFLLAGLSFFMSERPLIYYLEPWRDWVSLLESSVALLRTFY